MIKNDVRQTQNLTNTTKIDPNLRKIDKDRRYRKKDKNRLIAQKQTIRYRKKTKID